MHMHYKLISIANYVFKSYCNACCNMCISLKYTHCAQVKLSTTSLKHTIHHSICCYLVSSA